MDSGTIGNPPPIQEKTTKSSTGRKVVWGFVIGCGSLFVIALILIGIGVWWFMSTGDQVPTARILGPEATSVVKVGDISSDPGVTALLRYFVVEAQRAADEETGNEFLNALRSFERSQSDPTQFLKMISPREITMLFFVNDAETLDIVAAANLGMGTRALKLLLSKGAESAVEGEGPDVLKKIRAPEGELYEYRKFDEELEEEIVMGVVGCYKGTFLYSTDTDLAKKALDRLVHAPDQGALSKEMDALRAEFDQEGWLAYGILDGDVTRTIWPEAGFIEPDQLAQLTRQFLTMRVVSEDEVILRWVTEWPDEETAESADAALKIKFEKLIRIVREEGIKLSVTQNLEGERLVVECGLRGLRTAITQSLDAQMERRQHEEDYS